MTNFVITFCMYVDNVVTQPLTTKHPSKLPYWFPRSDLWRNFRTIIPLNAI